MVYRSGYSNVNVSQSNTNNDEDLQRSLLLPLSRVRTDAERSIGNVKRRVSALADGTVDRMALARSVLASRSLLDRNDDIDRLLDGLRSPLATSLDVPIHATHSRDRNSGIVGMAGLNDRSFNIDLQGDRLYAHGATLPQQMSKPCDVLRSDSINSHAISAGRQGSETRHAPADHRGPEIIPSRFCIAENRPESTNTPATAADRCAGNQQTSEDTGHRGEIPAAEQEQRTPADTQFGRSTQHSSKEDVRLFAEATKAGMLREKGNEVIPQKAEVFGQWRKPVSTFSSAAIVTPAASVTLQADMALNTDAHVTRDINLAASTSAYLFRPGRDSTPPGI